MNGLKRLQNRSVVIIDVQVSFTRVISIILHQDFFCFCFYIMETCDFNIIHSGNILIHIFDVWVCWNNEKHWIELSHYNPWIGLSRSKFIYIEMYIKWIPEYCLSSVFIFLNYIIIKMIFSNLKSWSRICLTVAHIYDNFNFFIMRSVDKNITVIYNYCS